MFVADQKGGTLDCQDAGLMGKCRSSRQGLEVNDAPDCGSVPTIRLTKSEIGRMFVLM